MVKKFLLFFIIIQSFSSGICWGQDGIPRFMEIFQKTEKFYKERTTYSLDVTYQFFDSKQLKTATETLTGRIEKKGTNYYSRIGPTEIIYLDDIFLKINHEEKAMLYAKVPNKKMTTPVDITALADYFKTATIKQKGNFIFCNVTFKEKSNIPYTKMLMVLDSKNYSIVKQELYMLPGFKYPSQAAANKKSTEGKMVIIFSPTNARNGINVFDISNYLKNTSKISLSSKLSSYQLYNTTQ